VITHPLAFGSGTQKPLIEARGDRTYIPNDPRFDPMERAEAVTIKNASHTNKRL